jgi:hypothetical protein
MIYTVKTSHRRSVSKKPFLLPLVGILVVAVVATVMQVRPQARADTVNGVQVTQHDAEAWLKAGTTATCVITDTATLQGDEKRVGDFVDAVSKSARDLGMKVTVGGGNVGPGLFQAHLSLSYEFELTQNAISPESCSTEKAVEAHRGRMVVQLPNWARGMVAAAAAVAVYLGVVFAVTALFAFLAPEFTVWGELIGGCIGGFASSFVSNWLNRVPQDANLTASAVQCVAGAVLNVTLGSLKRQMLDALRANVQHSLSRVVSMAISRGAGPAEEIDESFRTAASTLSAAMEELD